MPPKRFDIFITKARKYENTKAMASRFPIKSFVFSYFRAFVIPLEEATKSAPCPNSKSLALPADIEYAVLYIHVSPGTRRQFHPIHAKNIIFVVRGFLVVAGGVWGWGYSYHRDLRRDRRAISKQRIFALGVYPTRCDILGNRWIDNHVACARLEYRTTAWAKSNLHEQFKEYRVRFA